MKKFIGVISLVMFAFWVAVVYKIAPVVLVVVFNFKRFMG